jgi:ribosomal protein S18 acetylase RimI-like enzyme
MKPELHIRPLNPHDADVLIHYFQTLDYHHQPEWQTCYCQFYHQTCSMDEWIRQSEHGENEHSTRQAIEKGSMKGYLAFDGDLIVGWLNANHYHSYLRLLSTLKPFVSHPKTAVMICFVIHPLYRGQGVARRLIHYALQDLTAQGFTAVLALPREDPDHPQHRYRGTFHMFESAGFKLVDEKQDTRIYRYTMGN